MQSVIKLMPEPIPEVPREAPRDSGVSTSNDYGDQGRHSSQFGQEFDHQINQYNDKNRHGGSNQQAHADFPDENGNHQSDDRQQIAPSMTAEELRELANQAQKDAKGGIAAQNPEGKEDKPVIKPPVVAQAPKDSGALDALVAMVEDAEKLIRSDKGAANIDSEFLKQNKLTDAMDKALIGKQGDKRSVVDVLKGFAQKGHGADDADAATQAKQGQDAEHDPELAKLLGQIQGEKALKGQGADSQANTNDALKSLASGDKLQQGKAGQANLVIPGEPDSFHDAKSLDLLKIINGQKEGKLSDQLQGESKDKLKAQPQILTTSKADKQNAEQLANASENGDEQEMSIADFLAANSSKGEKGGQNGKDDAAQTKPMELATDKDKPTKPMELAGDKDKPIKPMELASANAANAVDEQSIAADEALKKQQSQSTVEQLNAERLKVDLKQPSNSQTVDTKNLQTQDKAAEHENLQLAGRANEAASTNSAKAQSAAQTIVTGDKRQNILGNTANAKSSNEAQGSVNSEKLAQAAAQEQQNNQGEQQFDDAQAGGEGVFDELMQTTMPKDAPMASNKMASQFGQTLNQFSNDSATRLNATTQTMSATGTEKTPPQVTETLHMTRPDLSVNMKERMTLMMKSGIQTADIRLDPAELGQMQVKMSVENDVTSVSFIVQNSQAKELLEKALPQLKEMLAEQGVEMGESSVSQQDQQQQQLGDGEGNGQGQMAGNGQNEQDVEEEGIVQQVNITNGAVGGIDFFA